MNSTDAIEALPAPAVPHSSVSLREPVTVVLDAAGGQGAVELSIPLRAFEPPLHPELWRGLVAARLPAPWGRRARVRCAVRGTGDAARLELHAEGVEASAWVRRPALLELEGRSGQRRLVALSAPAIAADFSAAECARTRDQRFATQRALVEARARLERLRAELAAPERAFARTEHAAWAEAAARLEGLRAEVRARRAEVVMALAVAQPATWAVAAEFSRADAGPAGEAIAELAAPLLELANAHGQAQRRALHLRHVIRALEHDPALPAAAKAEATFEHRAALADLEPKLEQLGAALDALVDTLQQRARDSGLGDALLAHGDFLLGQSAQTGAPGSFEHLLRAQAALEAEVDARRRLVEARTQVEGALAEKAARMLAARVEALSHTLADLGARLNWYAHAPVRHHLATRY